MPSLHLRYERNVVPGGSFSSVLEVKGEQWHWAEALFRETMVNWSIYEVARSKIYNRRGYGGSKLPLSRSASRICPVPRGSRGRRASAVKSAGSMAFFFLASSIAHPEDPFMVVDPFMGVFTNELTFYFCHLTKLYEYSLPE